MMFEPARDAAESKKITGWGVLCLLTYYSIGNIGSKSNRYCTPVAGEVIQGVGCNTTAIAAYCRVTSYAHCYMTLQPFSSPPPAVLGVLRVWRLVEPGGCTRTTYSWLEPAALADSNACARFQSMTVK